MCTVTFLPLPERWFCADFKQRCWLSREKALYPAIYEEEEVSLFYPKDGKAGGTWIGTSRNNRLICLLNGGFKNHKRAACLSKKQGLDR